MNLNTSTHVYLTGGTGFIGSHLRAALTDQKIPVTLLTRDKSSTNIAENERMQQGDVTNPETISMDNHDVVIHLAAQTSVVESINNPREFWRINADGTLNVLEAARKSDIHRFLYVSTASVYGAPTYLPIDELHPVNPAEPYGASKLAGDGLSRSYSSSYDLDTVVGRVFNAFGPRQPEYNVVPTIINQANNSDQINLGNLSPSRDFIYVNDVINALMTLISEGDPGVAYNIGQGKSISIGELADIVIDAFDKDIEVVSAADRQRSDDIEIPNHVADISRIQELGWRTKYTTEEGIVQTIQQQIR